MSCNACRAAVAHDNDLEIASKLHAACEAVCGCEKFRLGENSPGPVQDTEILDLIISDPQGIQNGKSPHPGILVQIDRAGLSVLRDVAGNGEFQLTIEELGERARASGKERFFHGVCSFRAGDIRFDEDERFLCIYDTALPKKPNHADIFGPDLKAVSGAEMSKTEHERRNRARIKKFLDRIEMSFVPARAFRDGALLEYSRPTGT